MAEVIKASGMSAGNVYRYFTSKDDLIKAIITDLMHELEDRLVEATAACRTPADLLAQLHLTAEATFRAEGSPYGRLLPQVWAEALRNPDIADHVERSYSVVLGHLRNRISAMQDAGYVAPDADAAGIAHVLLGHVQGYLLQSLLLRDSFDGPAYRTAAASLLHLAAPAAR